MNQLTVTQKILSLTATYLVTNNSTEKLALTIKGKLMSLTPKLIAYEENSEVQIATVSGNIFKTTYSFFDAEKNVLATIKFPIFAFIKKFTLDIKGESYKANGGVLARKFAALDKDSNEVLTISKELKVRDQFLVSFDDSIDKSIAAMAAVVIDQKFFQQK